MPKSDFKHSSFCQKRTFRDMDVKRDLFTITPTQGDAKMRVAEACGVNPCSALLYENKVSKGGRGEMADTSLHDDGNQGLSDEASMKRVGIGA